MSGYVVDMSLDPPSCLPDGFDLSGYIDMTSTADQWRKYFNPNTGHAIDCADYAEKAFGKATIRKGRAVGKTEIT